MSRKRNSLFPLETSSSLPSLVQLQSNTKSNLFGVVDETYEGTIQNDHHNQNLNLNSALEANEEIPTISKSGISLESPTATHNSNSQHRHTTSVSPVSILNSLGGNFYQLKSSQINKIINVKYGSDPLLLIRQLSMDLAQKETELILLRNEKFTREQQLYKLCNEYGNLSTLEIDKMLNEMSEVNINNNANTNSNNYHERNDNTVSGNVNDILKDLIGTAIHDDIQEPKESKQTVKKTVPNRAVSNGNDSGLEGHQVYSEANRNRSWLRGWFNSSEDLSVPQKTSTRPYSKSFPLRYIINESTEHEEVNKTPVPVELESMNMGSVDSSNDAYTEETGLDSSREDINIDKYGFFHDADLIVKSKSPPPTTQSRAITTSSLDDSSAILIGSKGIHQTIDHLKEISKIHDHTNQSIENQWDTLIKEITKDYYKYMTKEHNEAREIFGIRALNILKLDIKMGNNFLNEAGVGKIKNASVRPSSPHYDHLLSLINKFGISSKYRYNLWLELSGAKNLMINGEYEELLNEVKQYEQEETSQESEESNDRKNIIRANVKQIKLDLHRTLPHNYYFNNLIELKPGPNFYKLQRILYAFVAYRPDVGYLQGMNKIVGNLLLILSKSTHAEHENFEKFSEVDIFWIFIGLVEEILPKYRGLNNTPQVFFNSLENVRIDQMVLHRIYLKKFLPELCQHLTHLEVEIELITLNWWLTLFIDLNFVSLDTWFKLFDSLLVDDKHIKESAEGESSDTSNITSPSNAIVDNDISDRRAIKLISITLALLQGLEHSLMNMKEKEYVYELLNSKSSNFHVNEYGNHVKSKISLKYNDIMKQRIAFSKKISGYELSLYRQVFSNGNI
ncbi:hypothetical protein G9P44_000118 [Scheffersomyces stipitis]|nr:hypothetical protein G9P44_000118 [Scheffersomyces stipitis]